MLAVGGQRIRVELIAIAGRAPDVGEAPRRACGTFSRAAAVQLGVVERPRVHASLSLATLALVDVCKQTPPRGGRTPAACKTYPSPDRLLPIPRKCLRSGKDCGGDRASHQRPHYPGECDPQPMCTSFVAQQWHNGRHFVAPRQHSVNNRREEEHRFLERPPARNVTCNAHAEQVATPRGAQTLEPRNLPNRNFAGRNLEPRGPERIQPSTHPAHRSSPARSEDAEPAPAMRRWRYLAK